MYKHQFKIFGFLLFAFAVIALNTNATVNKSRSIVNRWGWMDTWTATLDSADVDTGATVEFPYRPLAKTTIPFSVALVETHAIAGTETVAGTHTGNLDTLTVAETATVALVDTVAGTLTGSYEATTRYDYRYQAQVETNCDTVSLACHIYGSMDETNWTLIDTMWTCTGDTDGDTLFSGTFDLNGQNWPHYHPRWTDAAGQPADSSWTITQEIWTPKE